MSRELTRRRPGEPWRDDSGQALTDYPRPSVAVDTAVLTLAPRTRPSQNRPVLQLHALLVPTTDHSEVAEWALPGTFVHQGERLGQAVTRSLTEKAGLAGHIPTTQLGVFDDPDRDPRGWVLSVAHLAGIPYERLALLVDHGPCQPRLTTASRPGPLPYDHADIVKAAVTRLQRLYRRGPDPLRLLGERFTMTQLRQVHEAIHGELLQKDTFRRAMEPLLKPTSTLSPGRTGRPSQLFARPRRT